MKINNNKNAYDLRRYIEAILTGYTDTDMRLNNGRIQVKTIPSEFNNLFKFINKNKQKTNEQHYVYH